MVMPSVDVYENFLKRSQAVAGGGHPHVCWGTHQPPRAPCAAARRGLLMVDNVGMLCT